MRSISFLLCVFALSAGARAQTPATPDASKIFAYDASKPLNLTLGKTETVAGGVTVSEISYDSPKGGRVPGYLVLPLTPPEGVIQNKPTCAVIYMHWGQGNRGEFLSEAVSMAVNGRAIGIMIDAPTGDRTFPRRRRDTRPTPSATATSRW